MIYIRVEKRALFTHLSHSVLGYTGGSFLPSFLSVEPQLFLADTLTLVSLPPRSPAKRRLKRPFDTNKPGNRGALWALQTPRRHPSPTLPPEDERATQATGVCL